MKIPYITVAEYLKTRVSVKPKIPKDIAKVIQVSKDATLGYDPKNIAEALVMINSVGIDKIMDYLG